MLDTRKSVRDLRVFKIYRPIQIMTRQTCDYFGLKKTKTKTKNKNKQTHKQQQQLNSIGIQLFRQKSTNGQFYREDIQQCLHVIKHIKGVWTQNFVKHIECCNFQTITVMYIKVYISGMEMSQRIHFWYQFFLKMMIFWENGKKHFFGQKLLWQPNKNSFELKCPNFGKITLRHISTNQFFVF